MAIRDNRTSTSTDTATDNLNGADSTEAVTQPDTPTTETEQPSTGPIIEPSTTQDTSPTADLPTSPSDPMPADTSPDPLADNMNTVAAKRTAGGEAPAGPWIADVPEPGRTTIDPMTGQVMTYAEYVNIQAERDAVDKSHG